MSDTLQATVQARLSGVKARVTNAAESAGRQATDIRLLAVSKKKPVSMIKEAMEAGQQDFGENYIQEATSKIPELRELTQGTDGENLRFHFIGHLQSNKAKQAIEHFDLIQTVDSLKLHGALANQCEKQSVTREGLIQVNVSGEEQKSGIKPSELPDLIDAFAQSERFLLKGLMMIGSFSNPPGRPNQKKGEFESLAYLAKREQERSGGRLLELSMGMSADIEDAIKYGATMIRVGTAIFGKRD